MSLDADTSQPDMPVSTFQPVSLRLIVNFLLFVLAAPAVLFATAGTLRWGMAWLLTIISLFFTLFSRVLVFRKHPDLLAERGASLQAENVKAWDRVIVPAIAMIGPVAVWAVAGLDHRWGWTGDWPLAAPLAALAVMIGGYAFALWAMVENRFFSALVRIQTDRGHTVCTTGPYRLVRHPGYAGGSVVNLAIPLVLTSLWALIPAALIVIMTVVRTALEDRTLIADLPGYADYTRQTRYRLILGLW